MKIIQHTICRGIAMRIIIPLAVIMLLAGLGLYGFNLRIISNFADRQVRESFFAQSREIYNICDTQLSSLLLDSGRAGDDDYVRIIKARTIGTIEEYLQRNNLRGVLTDGTGAKLIESRLPVAFSADSFNNFSHKEMILLSHGNSDYYMLHMTFDPWQWHLQLFKDAGEYAALGKEVRNVYAITVVILLTAGLLLLIVIRKIVSIPMAQIIKNLEKNQKPAYRGVAEFEFLSNKIGLMMDAMLDALIAAEGERARTEAFIAAIGDGISIQDRDFKVIYQNQAHKDIVGDHVGEFCYQAYEKQASVCRGCPVARSFADGNVHREERSAPTDDGLIHVDITTSPIRDASGEIVAGIEVVRNITGRKQMEEALLQSKTDWEDTFDTISDAITVHDRDFNIIRANRAAEEMIGLPFLGISKQKCYESYHGTTCPPDCCPACETLKTGKPAIMERYEPKLNRFMEVRTFPRFDADRHIIGLTHIVLDITERKRIEEEHKSLQEQLMQAQKMESVGRLAGGIAHDFNNILSAIIGYSEILQRQGHDAPRRTEYIEIIRSSGEKAADLTHQLLAFSRKQVLRMEPLSLSAVINDMIKMLRRIIGEDISLDLNTGNEHKNIMADKSQIEQVLLNLSVNARDAMPGGGTLTIEVHDVAIDENYSEMHAGSSSGPHIMLSVSDTGFGISREVQERIFEPFFTTKELGKGTGLGLATVYGIVKQHRGSIYVYSEPGKGTTFKLYFPAVLDNGQDVAAEEAAALPSGSETILAVDDEPMLLRLITDTLEPLGYRILQAHDGKTALELAGSHKGKIDLLLTDVVMPNMNGRQLSEALNLRLPEIKVIFMSGYTDDAIAHHGILDEGVFLIQKPLTGTKLARGVRERLDMSS